MNKSKIGKYTFNHNNYVELHDEIAESDSAKAKLFAEFFQKQYVQGGNIDLTGILNECGVNSLEMNIE